MTGKIFLLIIVLFVTTIFSTAQQLNNADSFKTRFISQRTTSHNFSSIAKPWGNCIDFPNNNRAEQITHHDIAWESIGKENSKPGSRIVGANWKGRYPALGESFSNLNESLERRKEALQLNPNFTILAELRWRDYMDSLLPADAYQRRN